MSQYLTPSHQALLQASVVAKPKAGVISDADFPIAPQDGTLGVDTTNSQLYVRVGGVWKKVAVA